MAATVARAAATLGRDNRSTTVRRSIFRRLRSRATLSRRFWSASRRRRRSVWRRRRRVQASLRLRRQRLLKRRFRLHLRLLGHRSRPRSPRFTPRLRLQRARRLHRGALFLCRARERTLLRHRRRLQASLLSDLSSAELRPELPGPRPCRSVRRWRRPRVRRLGLR